ncbi:MAG: 50S ribosomal protein L24 [Planctomycetales bacterium]|nr:50S ribosomal protein L24 [Planctomycetales bacterium]
MLIKVGDTVQVISGEHAGERGRVLRVDDEAGRVLVEGVNRVFKHVRRSQKNPQGGRLEKEMPIQASKVMLIDPKSGQRTRVGVRFLEDGSKERYAKKTGNSLGIISPPRAAHARRKA